MTIRTTRKTVTFRRPFSLSGVDKIQPSGTYTVDTDEELIDGLSFLAYRRMATLLHFAFDVEPGWRDRARYRQPIGAGGRAENRY